MSDFFSNLYSGIRKPDVVMNDGPLPPESTAGGGYPAGFNGTPDGKINLASTLLGDVSPYSYAEAERLSTQTAFLNIPHRAQRIIPTITLPEAQTYDSGGRYFQLSHQVDDGDVAFVIRAMFTPFELVADRKRYHRQGVLFQVDPVVNLATVNYILHGLQRYGWNKRQHKGWHTLWLALGIDESLKVDNIRKPSEALEIADALVNGNNEEEEKKQAWMTMTVIRRMVVDHLIKNVIRPFGVPLGSEKQGGQHQGSNKAVTWPVDFVTTMTIDGLVLNLVNNWRHDDINSGDDLMFFVENQPYSEYVLSHHARNCRKQCFGKMRDLNGVPEDVWKVLTTSSWHHLNSVYGRRERPEEAAALPVEVPMAEYVQEFHDEGADDPFQAMMKRMDAIYTGVTPAATKTISPMTTTTRAGHEDSKFQRILANIQAEMEKENKTKGRKIKVQEAIFQLVPGISSCTSGDYSEAVKKAVWSNGYWHIARSQVTKFCVFSSFFILPASFFF